jgi:tRNA pseudouridine32 synthase/23S rRNA pseudouridine746 synthase
LVFALDSPDAMTEEELSDLLPQRVLHRDANVLVIDKPFGVPVHKGPSSAAWKDGPALEAGFPALRFGLPRDPALAHRLDRDTSGCLVLGRHRKALDRLRLVFQQNLAEKTYWAVVEGAPEQDHGTIDLALGRKDATRGWWMKPDPAGLPAVTHWQVLGRAEGLAWLELRPLTGRTHQLRVHCQAMGWPIVGDTIYGSAPRFGGPGLHLHARAINLPFDAQRDPVHAEAPPPAHMRDLLDVCGWRKP